MFVGVCQASDSIMLVSSNSHFGIVHRIESELFSQPDEKPRIFHRLVDQINPSNINTEFNQDLIVTIGAEALETVLKANIKKPILAVLIRKHTFHNILNVYHRKLNNPNEPITAIYLDQPLQRQMNLIKQVMPEVNNDHSAIGVLFGPASINSQEDLLSIAHKENIKLNTIYVSNFENPVAVMDAFLSEVKVLLALPDTRIYNPRAARGILLAAFHKHVPLVGYSQSYVKNGALVSVFSNTKQVAHQAAIAILDILKTNELPLPTYPNEFSIEINYQVAKSLNIPMESESSLKLTLMEMEAKSESEISAVGEIADEAS